VKVEYDDPNLFASFWVLLCSVFKFMMKIRGSWFLALFLFEFLCTNKASNGKEINEALNAHCSICLRGKDHYIIPRSYPLGLELNWMII